MKKIYEKAILKSGFKRPVFLDSKTYLKKFLDKDYGPFKLIIHESDENQFSLKYLKSVNPPKFLFSLASPQDTSFLSALNFFISDLSSRDLKKHSAELNLDIDILKFDIELILKTLGEIRKQIMKR